MTIAYDPQRDSLTTILLRCGYTHRKASSSFQYVCGMRDVIDATGAVVFTGTYVSTLEWLVESGQAREQEAAQ